MSESVCLSTGSAHCWHGAGTHVFSNSADREEKRTYRCCRCGGYRTATFLSLPDPEHGPFAPKIMREIPA